MFLAIGSALLVGASGLKSATSTCTYNDIAEWRQVKANPTKDCSVFTTELSCSGESQPADNEMRRLKPEAQVEKCIWDGQSCQRSVPLKDECQPCLEKCGELQERLNNAGFGAEEFLDAMNGELDRCLMECTDQCLAKDSKESCEASEGARRRLKASTCKWEEGTGIRRRLKQGVCKPKSACSLYVTEGACTGPRFEGIRRRLKISTEADTQCVWKGAGGYCMEKSAGSNGNDKLKDEVIGWTIGIVILVLVSVALVAGILWVDRK